MALKLVSDFRDFYDHQFESHGTPFLRLSKGGMSRREMFPYFSVLGLETPKNGEVSTLAPELLSDVMAGHATELVVYTDEYAHCGDGKVRVRASDALRLYPDRFCSEYLSTSGSGAGRSLRYPQIGSRKWWLSYWSDEDWRSNSGEGGVSIINEEPAGYHPLVPAPLFAIDFLPIGSKRLAVDFNTAPGLGPLRDVLTPSEIVTLLGAAITRVPSDP